MYFVRLKQTGDTIVEVLIAILVISSVLGGAYTSANSSSNSNRQAQERGEALKLAEEQVEKIKALVEMPTLPAAGTSFCIVDPITVQTNLVLCKVTDRAAGYSTIIRRGTAPADNTYVVTSTWAKAGGGADQRLTITYRIYP